MDMKTIVVTGANSGIGYETAKHFLAEGYRVVMAVRNLDKGRSAKEEFMQLHPSGQVELRELDLSKLSIVHAFSERMLQENVAIDILVNNAGVMMPPHEITEDGFELQFASNHLGHFALTAQLLPLLEKSEGARVVSLSSIAYRFGEINFDNLDGKNGYSAQKFYGQSKLANLLFAKELDRRLKENKYKTISTVAHPGFSATNLFQFGKGKTPWYVRSVMKFFTQPAQMGSLPTIYAATEESLNGGEFIGPDGKGERKGNPTIVTPKNGYVEEDVMKRLWEVSEQLTGVRYPFQK